MAEHKDRIEGVIVAAIERNADGNPEAVAQEIISELHRELRRR
jgi:hypothetical protein